MFESSGHPTHLFFEYVSFDENAVAYTQTRLSRNISGIQYDLPDLDWRQWRHSEARSARHCTAVRLRNLCCGTLINIEYRAISGQIHRLYCWMNSLFYYNCQYNTQNGTKLYKEWIVLGQNEITKGSSFVNITSYKCLKSGIKRFGMFQHMLNSNS